MRQNVGAIDSWLGLKGMGLDLIAPLGECRPGGQRCRVSHGLPQCLGVEQKRSRQGAEEKQSVPGEETARRNIRRQGERCEFEEPSKVAENSRYDGAKPVSELGAAAFPSPGWGRKGQEPLRHLPPWPRRPRASHTSTRPAQQEQRT